MQEIGEKSRIGADHPYMAVTDRNGEFQLERLPAARVTLRVWHEQVGYITSLQVDSTPTDWERGRYPIDLSDGRAQQHQYVVPVDLFQDEKAK